MKTSIRKHVLIILTLLISQMIICQIPKEFDKYLTNVDTTGLFWKADKNPSFKGGQDALIKFYSEHFIYPEASQKEGIEGTVYVLFIIETDGRLTNVVSTNTIDGRLEKNAVKFIKKMPNWNPGVKNDKNVRVLNIQPVKFKLE